MPERGDELGNGLSLSGNDHSFPMFYALNELAQILPDLFDANMSHENPRCVPGKGTPWAASVKQEAFTEAPTPSHSQLL